MCKLYALYETTENIQYHYDLGYVPIMEPNYSISPNSIIFALNHHGEDYPMFYEWGFVPEWLKDKKSQYKMYKARLETVWTKPSFRNAIRFRRCLISASGYYESKNKSFRKQHYFVTGVESVIFSIAGIWEIWQDTYSKEFVSSCAILTTESKGWLKKYNDRMPVIIDREGYKDWLDPEIHNKDRLNIHQLPVSKLKVQRVRDCSIIQKFEAQN
jgi:putative SOS response-associated peptidase YedK